MQVRKLSGEAAVAASRRSKEKEYWLNQLSGELVRSNFPYDYTECVKREMKRLEFQITGELYTQLMKLGNGSDARLHMILMAEVTLLLSRYSGNQDLLLGMPIYKQEAQAQFINTILVIRNTLQPEMTFKDLLLQTRQRISEADVHKNYPLEMLSEELEVLVSNDGFRLFDLAVLLEEIHPREYLTDLPLNLIFTFGQDSNSIKGCVEFNAQLYEKETIQWIVQNLQQVFEQTLFAIDLPLAEVDVVAAEERERLLIHLNGTKMEYPNQKTVHQLFKEQVDRTPDKVAVCYQEQSITYGELDQKANQLANFLRDQKGIRPDDLVGLLMDSSIESVVGMLGVLKAGGAYVPFAPSLPEKRLKGMIQDAQIQVVLSQEKYAHLLNHLQWECANLHSYLCLDSEDIYARDGLEDSDFLDQVKLWEYVGETSTDDITGGGWISSYTGEPLSKTEMDEYGDNILKKLTPLLNPELRILEIGCASGISMFRIAPHVGFYYGTDLSQVIIEKNRQIVKERGIENIALAALPAHEIDKLEERDFDLIIINSVIQDFYGHNYLRSVIRKSVNLLSAEGHLFLGDLMDQDLKESLKKEMREFKRQHRDKGYRTKTDFSMDLFVSRSFVQDIAVEVPEICAVEFSEKIYTIENELTKFRYDALLYVDKERAGQVLEQRKHKYQYDRSVLEKYSTSRLPELVTPNHLAYILYTSGTTGKPQGVMVEHRGVVNTVHWFIKEFLEQGVERVLQLTDYTFDPSVEDIFGSLLSGGTLYVAPKELLLNHQQFCEYMDENHIQLLNFVPTILKELLCHDRHFPHLQVVISGGERLEESVKAEILAQGYQLYNNYGPTEVTVDILAGKCSDAPVTLGQPIGNSKCYILDPNQQLVPMGVVGELCVAGPGLARGYVNNQALTEAKFVPNPLLSGERIYRTGDLARRLPNGEVEFWGRVDEQVKIRGHRIELGEIKKALTKHVWVSDAVVITRKDVSGNSYLCGYYIADDPTLQVAELEEHLAGELPGYMIPAYLIPIETIPLNLNGKLDRNSLPDPGSQGNQRYVPPKNQVEAKLVEVWQEILGIEQIGVQDNFFEVGGDSIKAIQMSARLQIHQLKFNVGDVFAHQTIAELAQYVQVTEREIDQGVVQGEVPLTPIQKWFFEGEFGESDHFNQAVCLYRESGFAPELIEKVMKEIMEHHDALRTVYSVAGDQVVQMNRGLVEEGFELELISLEGQDDPKAVMEETANRIQGELNLEAGPLVKLGLFTSSRGDYLLLVIHHLVVDGVSWRIILEDLAIGYNQALQGQPIIFQEKTDSYLYWAEQLQEYGESKELLKEKSYWKKIEETPVEKLPRQRVLTEEEKKNKFTQTMTITLDQEVTSQLLTKAHQAYNTEVNDLLLATLGLAVQDWSGVTRFLINLEGHGREEISRDLAIQRTVGWFTSQYPVLLQVNQERGFGYYLQTVKENLRQIPKKGIGYGVLRYLTPDHLKEDILFKQQPEICFNYLGEFGQQSTKNSPFTLANVSVGELVSPEAKHFFPLEINGVVVDGQLNLSFAYNQFAYSTSDMKKLIVSYQGHLEELVSHCLQQKEQTLTPGDLEYSKLTIDELAQLEKNLGSDQVQIEDIYRLAPMQSGMLFHSITDQKSQVYFEQIILNLRGNLQPNLLETSFNQLIQRYEAFRTVFAYEKLDEPVQIVLAERRLQIKYQDISYMGQKERERYLEDEVVKDRETGFDLTRDLLMRVYLFKIGEKRYRLIWSSHHIIMDGWCIGVVFRDLMQIYRSLQTGQTLELAPTTPYKEYIKWLERRDQETGLAYWQEYLQDYHPLVSFSGMKGKKGAMEYQLQESVFNLDEEVTGKLFEIARQAQVTINTLFQTVWAILLHKYSSKTDLVFGSVVSGRSTEIIGIEEMVGLFVNTIPVRVKLEEGQEFCQLLTQVQMAGVRSKDYEYLTLAEIQAAVKPKGQLFDHIISFQNYPIDEVKGASQATEYGFVIEDGQVCEQTNYDLNVIVEPAQSMVIKFTYNGLVYTSEKIEKVAEHLREIFSQVADNSRLSPEKIKISHQLLTAKANVHRDEFAFDF